MCSLAILLFGVPTLHVGILVSKYHGISNCEVLKYRSAGSVELLPQAKMSGVLLQKSLNRTAGANSV